jgi:hypothetical protein
VVDESKMAQTLAERGSQYGNWREQAIIAQNVKEAFRKNTNWDSLPPYLRETLDMIASKVSRVLNGNPMYLDNVHDMVGYTKLAEDCMEQDIAGGVTGPRIVDLDHLDIQSIFNYLAEAKVAPAHFEDFCREHNITFTAEEEAERNES